MVPKGRAMTVSMLLSLQAGSCANHYGLPRIPAAFIPPTGANTRKTGHHWQTTSTSLQLAQYGDSHGTDQVNSNGRRPKLIKTYDPDLDFAAAASTGNLSDWPFDDGDLSREDEVDDSEFYSRPRFVKHVDEWATLSLTSYYRDEIARLTGKKAEGDRKGAGASSRNDEVSQNDEDDSETRRRTCLDVLDLCSSWVSHLPADNSNSLGNVVGVGMNAKELERNEQLTSFFVQDLNVEPNLPVFEDGTFDVILCACSVDYLVKPREVFREIHRVLRPGGIVLITFSNRYFRKKAVSCWLNTDDRGRMDIVSSYFHHSILQEGDEGREEWASIEAYDIKLDRSVETVLDFITNQDLFRWFATAIFRGTWATDPLFAVKATKG